MSLRKPGFSYVATTVFQSRHPIPSKKVIFEANYGSRKAFCYEKMLIPKLNFQRNIVFSKIGLFERTQGSSLEWYQAYNLV